MFYKIIFFLFVCSNMICSDVSEDIELSFQEYRMKYNKKYFCDCDTCWSYRLHDGIEYLKITIKNLEEKNPELFIGCLGVVINDKKAVLDAEQILCDMVNKTSYDEEGQYEAR